MSSISLRYYQDTDSHAIRVAFRKHRSVMYCAPCGSGKTVLFCYIVESAAGQGTRSCIIIHRRELLRQASDTLTSYGIPHGIIGQGYPRTNEPIQVASKDTLIHILDRYDFDLLICDEAHHATAKTYEAIWRHYHRAKVLGVSATPCRMTGAGLGTIFDTMVTGPTVRELMDQGYLASYRYFAPASRATTKGLRSRAGDFNREDLEKLMDQRHITGDAIEHYRTHLNGLPTIVYCASVAHAEHTAALYREAGFRAESVDGSLASQIRDERIAGIGNGRLNALMSCDLISEGLNVPGVYGVQLLRHTKSIVIHMQQLGRCLRPAPGKREAIILDHVGNWARLQMLPDTPRTWTLEQGAVAPPREKDQPAPVLQCPECYFVHDPAPKCPACGHVYDTPKPKRVPKQKEGTLVEVSPERAAEMFRTAKTLSEFHAWARAAGKSSGAAFCAFKRRLAASRLHRAKVGGK